MGALISSHEIPFLTFLKAEFLIKTAYERQFDWGGHLLNGNGGVQR